MILSHLLSQYKTTFPFLSRRDFFKGGLLSALTGLFGTGCSSTSSPRITIPTFKSLGVEPVINCQGTYTIMSGCLPLPEVVMAMNEACKQFVHMDELMAKVGPRLGELTGAEYGIVTTGCAAALSVATCACVAGTDPEKMALLPKTDGMPSEVISFPGHRNVYDHAIRQVGVDFITVESIEEMEQNISPKTAMIATLGMGYIRNTDITIEDVAAVKNKYGIPLLVDAAAERPDAPNKYIQAGADLVCYSGGKPLFGPQSSGLLLGQKDLCQAAFLNSAPHHSLGRPMKISKELVMGCLAAVEMWAHGRDHEQEQADRVAMLNHIQQTLESVDTVHFDFEEYDQFGITPKLWIFWDQEKLGISSKEAHDQMYNGKPRVKMYMSRGGLWVRSYTLQAGEERIVARRLKEVLTGGGTAA